MAKKHHKTFFGKIFGSLWDFLKSAFEKANHGLLETLVVVTNKVKDALNSGVVDFATKLIPTDIDDKLVALLREKLPKVIKSEIIAKNALEEDMTQEEGEAAAQEIIDTWKGYSEADRAEFYTTLGSKLYIYIMEHERDETVTFGEAASFIEASWKAWLKANKDKDNDES